MSVGLSAPGAISSVAGIRLASACSGMRYKNRDDLALLEISPQASVAAVFTQNKFRAAPVNLAIKHLGQTSPRYLIINAGNANAGTGKAGIDSALQTAVNVASVAGVSPEEVLPFSTGVIGEVLNPELIQNQIPKLYEGLSADHWIAAANAIMTTDTVAKAFSKTIKIKDAAVVVSGIAKGSGMICPDMATMLAYIATDISISRSSLQKLLEQGVECSFNAITVDGDTSTNDSCVLIATGKSSIKYESLSSDERGKFDAGLLDVMQLLAQAIVRDGEGASKFVCVKVCNALSVVQAKTVAYSVANSPLVKTALAASDPNWGRIMAAAGYARDSELDLSHASLSINGVAIWSKGVLNSEYREEKGKAAMAKDEIEIEISLELGTSEKSVWTTDLTHEYIKINADYRT